MLRLAIALSVLLLFNAYVVARLIARWPWAQQHLAVIILAGILIFMLELLGPFGDRLIFPKFQHDASAKFLFAAIDRLSYLTFGVMSIVLIYIMAIDIVTLLLRLAALPRDVPDLDRRALLTLGAITAGTAVVGVAQAAAGPQVREVSIPLANLPSAFDGYRIVQISDLHVGPIIGHDYAAKVVAIANGLKPDLLALTGDFIDGTLEALRPAVAPLAGLVAPDGKFFVTGNHEYYWGAAAWNREYERLGMRVLSNQHVVLRRDGSEIVLAGVPDYSTLHLPGAEVIDPNKALAGAPPDRVKILLAHQPVSYKLSEPAGFDLQLSGHTHAGQYFPFNLFIGLFQHYYKGLNRHKNMWIYVNAGTGYWGPPLRGLVPSEITLITLKAA